MVILILILLVPLAILAFTSYYALGGFQAMHILRGGCMIGIRLDFDR